MKRAVVTVLVCLFVLGLQLGTANSAQRTPDEKLIDAQDIIAKFDQGQEKVKVIVNLAEPQIIKAATDWNVVDSLQSLHEQVELLQAPVLSTLSKNEFKLRHRFENQAGFSGEVTLGGLDKLLNDPLVESIEPVYVVERLLAQGIPLMKASVSRATYNGQGVAIAIIDDGIDYTHSKLGGGGFPNSKVIGGYDIGEIDDDPFPSYCLHVIPNESGEYYYYDEHGTCCAGIAAGDVGTTGDYIGGVAYGSKLYALKVADSVGDIYSDDVTKAWDWCVTHKNDDPAHPILVISTSLGAGRYYSACDWDGDEISSAYRRAADNAVAAGITVLAASGNDGYCDSIVRPACIGNVISVGAVYDDALGTHEPCVSEGSCVTKFPGFSCDYYASVETSADLVQPNSNTASFLDVLAPGTETYTLDVAGPDGFYTGDYDEGFGGTSPACAYAAGAVACLQSAAKACTGNYLSPAQIRSILTSTGDNITDSKASITKPRINLGQAINSICDTSTATEYDSNDVPKAIPDPGTVESTIVIDDEGTIFDLNVELNISHTWDSDLDVYLIAPDGTTKVELFTDVGGPGDDFTGTTLDDEAHSLITEGSAPFTGSYQPEDEDGLSKLDGMSITGAWTLEITDDFGAYSGTLNSWSLIIETDSNGLLPQLPTNPYPPDGAENVPVDTCLSWSSGSSLSIASDYGTRYTLNPEIQQVLEASGHSLTQEEGILATANRTFEYQKVRMSAQSALPVVTSFPAPSEFCRGMCFDGTYLYIPDATTDGVFDDHIYKLNSALCDVVRTYDAPSTFPMGLAWDGVNFYVSDDTDTVIHVTDTSFSQVGTLPVPEKWCRDMAWDGTYLWLVTTYTDKVWKLNSDTGAVVDSFSAPGRTHGGLAWDGAYLWVAWDDQISKVDPASGTVLETYQAPGTETTGLAWDNGYLWCVDWNTDTIYKLEVAPVAPSTVTWDVYLGTDPNALELIASDLSEPNYCPIGLEVCTTYYWQVVAENPSGQRPGPIWSFVTRGGLGPLVHVIEDPSYEFGTEWMEYETNSDEISAYRSPLWSSEGVYSFDIFFHLADFHDVNDYGCFRQTVDWTSVHTLVFDYYSVSGEELMPKVLIGGTKIWPKDSLTDGEGSNVHVDVSGITGPQVLELRAESTAEGFFYAVVYFDNLRTYGPCSEGRK